jgi:hypothetical protein
VTEQLVGAVDEVYDHGAVTEGFSIVVFVLALSFAAVIVLVLAFALVVISATAVVGWRRRGRGRRCRACAVTIPAAFVTSSIAAAAVPSTTIVALQGRKKEPDAEIGARLVEPRDDRLVACRVSERNLDRRLAGHVRLGRGHRDLGALGRVDELEGDRGPRNRPAGAVQHLDD